jgi:hypothetical protein
MGRKGGTRVVQKSIILITGEMSFKISGGLQDSLGNEEPISGGTIGYQCMNSCCSKQVGQTLLDASKRWIGVDHVGAQGTVADNPNVGKTGSV